MFKRKTKEQRRAEAEAKVFKPAEKQVAKQKKQKAATDKRIRKVAADAPDKYNAVGPVLNGPKHRKKR